MTRLLEIFRHLCHVCSSSFDVAIHEHDDLKLEYRPPACVRCDAPLRFRSKVDVGMAKTLLLTMYKVPAYRKMYSSAEAFLIERAASVEGVDQYLEAVAALDYDAWKTFNEELRAGRKPNATERAEEKALAEIRAAAANGTLLTTLTSIANRVKARFAVEYAPYYAKIATRE